MQIFAKIYLFKPVKDVYLKYLTYSEGDNF